MTVNWSDLKDGQLVRLTLPNGEGKTTWEGRVNGIRPCWANEDCVMFRIGDWSHEQCDFDDTEGVTLEILEQPDVQVSLKAVLDLAEDWWNWSAGDFECLLDRLQALRGASWSDPLNPHPAALTMTLEEAEAIAGDCLMDDSLGRIIAGDTIAHNAAVREVLDRIRAAFAAKGGTSE